MESNVNYTVVGIFVLALLTAIVVIILWLSVGFEQKNYKTYLVYMNESVAGLEEKAPVKYNGVNVGFVDQIELNRYNPQQVILTLKIEPNIPITENTTAILMEQGITGIAYLGLKGGNHAKTLEALPGQEYPVIKSQPSFLVQLDTTVRKLTDNINSLTNSVQQLLNKENLTAVRNALQNIETVTGTLAKNNDNLDSSIKNLQITLKNTASASKEFPNITTEIQDSARALRRITIHIAKTTSTIDKTFSDSDTTIQEIQTQLLPQAYDAFDNFNDISKNLKTFSSELKDNPAILIYGKSAPKPGPGE